jgi:hypothetical protein
MEDLQWEIYKKELIDNLYQVGISKSLGYLPILTITSEVYCNLSIQEVLDYAVMHQIKSLVLPQPECNIGSGAVYFYNEDMLMSILQKNKEYLQSAGIPHEDCLMYIRYISNRHVSQEKYHEAYQVVALTFNLYTR